MDIRKVMKPRSIAVVGVSDRKGSFGNYAAQNALRGKLGEKVYFVHPKRQELLGKKCYPCISDLPEAVDCVVLCTPSSTIVPLMEEAGKKGIGGAVVFASGFSEEREEAGKKLEKRLIEVAKTYDMAVIGPNCLGLMNNVDQVMMWGLDTKFEFNDNIGVGVVGQSGFIIKHLSEAGFGMSYMASTGNGNIVTIEDVLLFYAQEDAVSVIAVYLEGIKKPEIFENALKTAAEKRKPFIVLKSGRSKKGAAATASHTGNLAGDSATYDAIFEKFGVVVAEDFADLIALTRMFTVLKGTLAEKGTLASLNLSGGETAVCADICEKYGLVHPDFDANVKKAVMELLPPFATPNNPLDATTALMYNVEGNKKIVKALLESDEIGIITLGINIGLGKHLVVENQINAACAAVEESSNKKPIFAVSSFEGTRNRDYLEQLERHGIVMPSGGEKAYRQIAQLVKFSQYDPSKRTLSFAYPSVDNAAKQTVALSEYDSKEAIKEAGITIPKQAVVTTKEELKTVLEKEFSFPVVLKVSSADILHKTDAGGVKLSIQSQQEALQAFDEIMVACKNYMPDAVIDGVLVQEMAPKGIEIIIGISNDALFGPMVLVGLGGVFVEIFKDVALYPAPMNKDEALGMLKKLKAYKLLTGYRGSKPADVDALAETIVKISDYAAKHRDTLKELDLNPVFVYEEGKGLSVVDALLIQYQS